MQKNALTIDGVKSGAAASLKYIVLVVYAVLAVYPFLWILMTSLKDNSEVYGRPFSLPSVWRFSNYKAAWVNAHVGTNFANSLIISFAAVAVMAVITAMAAYIIARVRPSFLLYTFFTVGIMIPIHAMLIPTFILVKNIGLINTRTGLIIVYIAGHISLSVFILVGFMKTLPKELEESALLDGCGWARTFFSIIFPLSKPGIATVSTLSFLHFWNDYLFGTIIISSPRLKTLTIGIADMKGEYFTEYGILCAGLTISIIPVTVIYILFQEQVIKGMTAGAVKG